MTAPQDNERTGLDAGNWIGLAALTLSIVGLGWQVRDALVGHDLQMLGLSQRVVEFRCHTSSVKSGENICWGAEDGSAPPTGRLTLVAPVFFVNQGAAGYNGVVDRVTASIDLPGRNEPIDLVAHGFWNLAQDGSGNSNRPYAPILVEGGKSNGAELRFVALQEEFFEDWLAFAEGVAAGELSDLTIKISAEIVALKAPLTQTCRVKFSDIAKATLQRRIDLRSSQRRVTAVCA